MNRRIKIIGTNRRIIICILFIVLTGCATKTPNGVELSRLTRVDVEVLNSEGNYEKAVTTITDEKTINILKQVFGEIKWEYNVDAKLSRAEDVKANLFFKSDDHSSDKSGPLEYQIWFDQPNDTAMLATRDEENNGAIGTLDKENTNKLKTILHT